MFAHKEISRKFCGPTRSESAPRLLGFFYGKCRVNIWYPFGAVFVLIFHRINFSSSAITPFNVLISVESSRMHVKDLQTVAEQKKKKKN